MTVIGISKNVVLVWIRLPGLLGYLYKRQIIEPIGGLIGKVVKLDIQTNNSTRGQFACLAVFVNLDKPLTSKLCPLVGVDVALERPEAALVKRKSPAVVVTGEIVSGGGDGKNDEFGPWMLVERKCRRGSQNSQGNGVAKLGNELLSSRFTSLIEGNGSGGGLVEAIRDYDGGKEGRRVILGDISKETRDLDKRVLDPLEEIGRGVEMGPIDVVRPVLGSGISGLNDAGTGIDELKKGEAQSSNAKISGLREDQTGPNSLLDSNRLMSNGLESSFSNEHNIFLNNQYAGNISSNALFDQGMGKEHSGSLEIMKDNLILNNPMFKGFNESVVKLDANFLDQKNHSAVIIRDNIMNKTPKENKKNILVNTNKSFSVSRGRGFENKINRGGASLNRSFKDKGGRLKNAEISRILLSDAISSMVNLVNSQGEPGSDVIGGNAEGKTSGHDSISA
ncbi:hypothetical protein J1N35_007067 [Gossypium stocksii]|uniref:DUF4283 domain-containing protein n=1 Tax=Gossypium stocksii TaxID=47602 RepID=A0A9D3W5S4_9ROSI|nr:hypothetical protein J1N35_007067 [Gossypium stocksii]